MVTEFEAPRLRTLAHPKQLCFAAVGQLVRSLVSNGMYALLTGATVSQPQLREHTLVPIGEYELHALVDAIHA